MSDPSRTAAKRLLIGLAFLIGPAPVHAVSFDVIVPQTVEIRTSNFGVASLVWGWVVATSAPITVADLQGVVLQGTITGTPTATNQSLLNIGIAPLAPTDVFGGRTVQNAAAYDPLLQPGESLKGPSFSSWQTGFQFPFGFTGTETFTASITLGSHTATYTTSIEFGSFDETIVITSGQRLRAVPEPGTFLLLAGAIVGLGMRTRLYVASA